MRCATCANTYHPATGHALSATTVLCGVCALDWARWVKATLRRAGKRGGGLYEAAATSVRAGERAPAGERMDGSPASSGA